MQHVANLKNRLKLLSVSSNRLCTFWLSICYLRTMNNNGRHAFVIVILLLIGGVALESCKKYEDGPRFSVKSKGKRLEGTWNAVYLDNNGIEFFQYYALTLNQLESTKHPEGIFNSHSKFTGTDIEIKYLGTWELSDNKEEVVLYNSQEEYYDGQSWTTSYNYLSSHFRINR